MRIYPIPRHLPTNPYIDLLYAPFAAWPEFNLRRIPFAAALRELLVGSGPRLAHWHFFDELIQRPSRAATAARSLAFATLLRALRLRGVRLVWTAHNIEPHELRHPAWAERAYRAMSDHADAVIAHSAAAAALLRARYNPKAPIHVIPHGAFARTHGPRRDRASSRAALGLPTDEFVALNLGIVRPYKGLELLLEAWEGAGNPRAGRLLLAGEIKDQAYAAAIRAQAASLAGVDLRLGFVPDADLPLWFGAADVVVLPYRKLFTSGILLLALTYGVPVIAPDVAPVRELVRDGEQGFLFAPGDAASLRATLARAAAHPDLTALGEAAYAAAEPFDWPTIARRTGEVYRATVAR